MIHKTCDELGVCNGRHCTDVAACPDYDLVACNSGNCYPPGHAPRCPHSPVADRRRASPVREAFPTPTYPFSPGIIQGPDLPVVYLDDEDGPWLPLAVKDLLGIFALVLLFAFLGGLLVGYMPAILKWVNT
ncbi:MAG: hypothetical protein PHH58_17665 [Rhodoferax sp.]|nr:hypothetical protein [Rhodoferax sp.]